MDGEEWLPGNQFYNETSTNQITIKFSAGRQRESLGFTVVVTPLFLACSGASYGFDKEQFWCGGPGEEGYCVDSGLVCDWNSTLEFMDFSCGCNDTNAVLSKSLLLCSQSNICQTGPTCYSLVLQIGPGLWFPLY